MSQEQSPRQLTDKDLAKATHGVSMMFVKPERNIDDYLSYMRDVPAPISAFGLAFYGKESFSNAELLSQLACKQLELAEYSRDVVVDEKTQEPKGVIILTKNPLGEKVKSRRVVWPWLKHIGITVTVEE